ncbi:MAG TPA: hypothetical protein VG652_09375 [Gaiellaceae bacterium]|nr:hypothetical protein [Gaiellaceae bacterium]
MARHLLVVVNTEVPTSALRALVYSRGGKDAEMLVVAPASDISRLDWLTNAEDDARAGAASLAGRTADAIPTGLVDAQVGDSDPLNAIEDALRTFPADEILVVSRPDAEATWLESGSGLAAQERFSLPVTRVTVAETSSFVRVS